MTTTRNALAIVVLSSACLAAAGSQAEAASRFEVAYVAEKLSREAQEVYENIDRYHTGAPEHLRLKYDAAEVYHFADYIRRFAEEGKIHHMESCLAELTFAFEHLKKLTGRIPSVTSLYRVGNPEGDVYELRRQMRELETTFDRLCDDVRDLIEEHGPAATPPSQFGRAESPRTRYPYNNFTPRAGEAERLIRP